MKRVLILTASYGSGHNAAARCLAPAFERERCLVTVVDHEFIARGTPPERLIVTGMPVRANFAEPVDPAATRAALGLSDRAPVVLAMAGSRGSLGRLPDVVRALDTLERPLQGLVVAGHDVRLRQTLERLTDGTRVRTLGYVEDVRRLMAAADILVTKAGGLTLAEAMAAELPVLAYGSLPGQERRNERFAARAGLGLVARSYLELVHLLDRALGDPDLLERLRARIRRVRRPDATQRIVAAVLELLERPVRRP